MPATNVKSRWNAGDLEFLDSAGNVICTFDGTARELVFPATGILNLAAGSIDTDDVADGAVTYAKMADSRSLQTVRVTLTAPEIKALNATPQELVAAPGAGHMVEVQSVVLRQVYGSEVFTGDRNLDIGYDDVSTTILDGNIAHGDFHQNAEDRTYIAVPNDGVNGVPTLFENQNIAITALVGEIGGNASDDTTWVIDVAYRVHDFS